MLAIVRSEQYNKNFNLVLHDFIRWDIELRNGKPKVLFSTLEIYQDKLLNAKRFNLLLNHAFVIDVFQKTFECTA